MISLVNMFHMGANITVQPTNQRLLNGKEGTEKNMLSLGQQVYYLSHLPVDG